MNAKRKRFIKKRRRTGPFRADGAVLPDHVKKKYSPRKIQLTIRMLHPEPGAHYAPSILIEGDKSSLEYLANVIIAVVGDEDCGFGFVGPGVGSISKSSEFGLYIHRLPCINGKLASKGLVGH